MQYIPNPKNKIDEMLSVLGLSSLSDLFNDIPFEIRQKCVSVNDKPGESELEVRRHLEQLAQENWSAEDAPIFLGAGCYDHYIPAAVDYLLKRSEFSTSYTPYQPEISQGILQGIFEYQSLICRLTEMDVANASLYCGGSALAAACRIASEATKKRKVLLPTSLHPEYAQIVKSAGIADFYETVDVPIIDAASAVPSGVIDLNILDSILDEDTAAVVIPYPNFYGCLEPVGAIIEKVRAKTKALVIMSVDPFALALLKPPGQWGADIAVGDAQVLGNRMSFGGPHLGFIAVTEKLLRKIPGRLVGQTVDDRGNRSFVLTLQAREQHIRREKANSNICSNQALCALATSMYLALIGPDALKQAAEIAHRLTNYAKQRFQQAGFHLRYSAPVFREFAISLDRPTEANEFLLENGIIGGYELNDALLFALTEKRTREEVDELVDAMIEFSFPGKKTGEGAGENVK